MELFSIKTLIFRQLEFKNEIFTILANEITV